MLLAAQLTTRERSRAVAQRACAGPTATARSGPAPVFSKRHGTSAGMRTTSPARTTRLTLAQEERGMPLLDHPHLRRRRVRRAAALARSDLHEHDVDVRSVLGSGEHPAHSVLGQRLTAANTQIGALLQLVLDGDRIEPGLAGGRDPVLA
jgi:hypothetical protein